MLTRVGAFYDARLHFERALELDPDNATIIIPLAHILHELGEHAEAIALVEKAYLKRPRDPLTLSALAYGLAQVGEYDRALEHAEMALKTVPDLIPALDVFALLTAYHGEPEKGIARVAALLRAQKSNPLFYLSTAAAMSRDGRYADAITLAKEALQAPTTRTGAYLLTRQNFCAARPLRRDDRTKFGEQAAAAACRLNRGDRLRHHSAGNQTARSGAAGAISRQRGRASGTSRWSTLPSSSPRFLIARRAGGASCR